MGWSSDDLRVFWVDLETQTDQLPAELLAAWGGLQGTSSGFKRRVVDVREATVTSV